MLIVVQLCYRGKKLLSLQRFAWMGECEMRGYAIKFAFQGCMMQKAKDDGPKSRHTAESIQGGKLFQRVTRLASYLETSNI